MKMIKSKAFYNGYDSKVNEIQGMGWCAARDKLNLDYPRGERYKGSLESYNFMQGESEALSNYMNKGTYK